MKKPNLTFDQKLLSYSLTAGIILLGGEKTDAQIFGTSVELDMTSSQSYMFNFDGEDKFRMFYVNSGTTRRAALQPWTSEASFIATSTTQAPKGLASGYVINSTKHFGRSNFDIARFHGATWTFGETAFRNQTKYFGLRFKLSGEMHYGWIKISINDDFTNLHLYSYAWEQTPDDAITADGVLPVELSSFTAEKNSDNIILNWQTAAEVNNSGFEIERNIDPKSGETKTAARWEKIGFVNGHGTSSVVNQYSFTDEFSSAALVIYRLKQVDNDGTFSYSKTVAVENTIPEKFELSQNYPNPFNPVTKIKYSIPEKANVRITLYDILGSEVSALINKEHEAGNYEIEFDGSNLNSGTYFYKLEAGNFTETKKLMLLK